MPLITKLKKTNKRTYIDKRFSNKLLFNTRSIDCINLMPMKNGLSRSLQGKEKIYSAKSNVSNKKRTRQ